MAAAPSSSSRLPMERRRRRRTTTSHQRSFAAVAAAAAAATIVLSAMMMSSVPQNRHSSSPTTASAFLLGGGSSAPAAQHRAATIVGVSNGNGRSTAAAAGSASTSRTRHQAVSDMRRLSAVETRTPPAARRSSTSSPSQSPSDHRQVSDFELSVGRALDTLRGDYPHLLTRSPDFSLYDRQIEVIDPSGVTVHGLQTYKNSFKVLHAIVKVFYCPDRSELTFKLCFDKARQSIRCSWNARVVPREIFGGQRTTLHVDGISVYELDRDTGNITQHRIEQLLINNEKVRPKEGVIAALHAEHTLTAPSYVKQTSSSSSPPTGSHVFEFRGSGIGGADPLSSLLLLGAGGGGGPLQQPRNPTTLFAMEANGQEHSSSELSASSSSSNSDGFNWDSFESKNRSRKKFGLKPLTRDEFLELEAQVKQQAQEQRQKHAAAAAASSAAEMNEKKGNFFQKLFGEALKDTCETNFDCERPEICCDFGFKKMCCSSGTPVGQNVVPQYATVPVPVSIEDPGNFNRY